MGSVAVAGYSVEPARVATGGASTSMGAPSAPSSDSASKPSSWPSPAASATIPPPAFTIYFEYRKRIPSFFSASIFLPNGEGLGTVPCGREPGRSSGSTSLPFRDFDGETRGEVVSRETSDDKTSGRTGSSATGRYENPGGTSPRWDASKKTSIAGPSETFPWSATFSSWAALISWWRIMYRPARVHAFSYFSSHSRSCARVNSTSS
ncbi:hypothetical protein C8F04DRAFT_1139513 [Mycena alexandri]|uniref:Uncharacterized protein n=1 Tax=Mycena alexandri TaxID=1745969 RepID=A0AAD6S795_9AGAR|nr:hypothetical protein C8F04DRAFT_1139513 [Mycena alexandri]